VVATVVAGGGEDEPPASPADPRCLRAWNSDPAALAYGRHNFRSHDYDGALVTFLDLAAREVDRGPGGNCVVIFPSRALDPEPFAAGEIVVGAEWLPISSLHEVALPEVAELQATAAAGPNASLRPSGRLAPFEK
jgi:hypothetical protein